MPHTHREAVAHYGGSQRRVARRRRGMCEHRRAAGHTSTTAAPPPPRRRCGSTSRADGSSSAHSLWCRCASWCGTSLQRVVRVLASSRVCLCARRALLSHHSPKQADRLGVALGARHAVVIANLRAVLITAHDAHVVLTTEVYAQQTCATRQQQPPAAAAMPKAVASERHRHTRRRCWC